MKETTKFTRDVWQQNLSGDHIMLVSSKAQRNCQGIFSADNSRVKIIPAASAGCFKSQGFTLVELLVVIAIISVLAGMLMPVLENSLDSAKQIACANKLKQLGIATTCYADDNNGLAPIYTTYSGTKYWWWHLIEGEYMPSLPNTTDYSNKYINFYCPAGPKPIGADLYGISMRSTSDINIKTMNISGAGLFVDLYYVNNKVSESPILGDSLDVTNNRQSVIFNARNGSTYINYALSLRHFMRANTWFTDGHVSAIDSTTAINSGVTPLAVDDYGLVE